MSTEPDRWEALIAGLRDGDSRHQLAFWEQYGPLLHQVAEKNLSPGLRRRLGPEDVVQSACRTFLRRAQVGQFQLADTDALWRLLCVITLTKIREQARFHLRQKRGLQQEAHAHVPQGSDSISWDVAAPQPTPSEAIAFADQLEQLLSSFDEEERQIVDLKLQDFTQEEIAEKMACSERTVRRILKRVQSRLAREFDQPKE